jgi:hypothetical protein
LLKLSMIFSFGMKLEVVLSLNLLAEFDTTYGERHLD